MRRGRLGSGCIKYLCRMKKTDLETLTSGSILYYPTIEFQSDTWLKAAICVWEKVYRIVPFSYKPHDSDEVKEAIDAGLVESIKLEKEDLAKAASDFQSFMDGADTFPASLSGYDNIDIRIHPEKLTRSCCLCLKVWPAKLTVRVSCLCPGRWL